VTVAEHDVPPRWHIPAQVLKVCAPDATSARAQATQAAHRAAGCPPWKPLLRISYPYTSATPLARAA
jgi:hypothetical protein